VGPAPIKTLACATVSVCETLESCTTIRVSASVGLAKGGNDDKSRRDVILIKAYWNIYALDML
jgi:hypothetical protein